MGYQLPVARFVGPPNGKVWTYAANTNVALPTYSDAELTTLNANPVILDAYGRGKIFVAAGVAYKIVVQTSAGALVYSEDDIVAAPEFTLPAPSPGLPPGTIADYGGNAAPAGWVLCDGSAYPRADPLYAALFAVIGTTYGAGNGSTTFNVPNCKGKFRLGVAIAGTGSVMGSTGGALDHVHTVAAHTHNVAAHTHNVPSHQHSVPRDGWGGVDSTPPVAGRLQAGGSGTGSDTTVQQATTDQQTGASTALVSTATALVTDAAGAGNSGPNNPPYIVTQVIIKL